MDQQPIGTITYDDWNGKLIRNLALQGLACLGLWHFKDSVENEYAKQASDDGEGELDVPISHRWRFYCHQWRADRVGQGMVWSPTTPAPYLAPPDDASAHRAAVEHYLHTGEYRATFPA